MLEVLTAKQAACLNLLKNQPARLVFYCLVASSLAVVGDTERELTQIALPGQFIVILRCVETLLPLTLSASKRANLSLAQSIALITANPAQRLGINAGHLAVGAHADICIFDPEYKWTPEQHWHSKGRNSHFLNTELTGKVYHTLVNGERVYTRTS